MSASCKHADMNHSMKAHDKRFSHRLQVHLDTECALEEAMVCAVEEAMVIVVTIAWYLHTVLLHTMGILIERFLEV